MGRYLGPKNKVSRAFGDRVFGYSKVLQRRKKRPGQHCDKPLKRTEYGQLESSKKKILYVYGIRERQLSNMVLKAARRKENTEDVVSRMLETRLDSVVYRLGLAGSRKKARQMVSHKFISVNDKVVNVASYSVKKGDIIKCRDNECVRTDVKRNNCTWLEWDDVANVGRIMEMPALKDVSRNLNVDSVVEFYSR